MHSRVYEFSLPDDDSELDEDDQQVSLKVLVCKKAFVNTLM